MALFYEILFEIMIRHLLHIGCYKVSYLVLNLFTSFSYFESYPFRLSLPQKDLLNQQFIASADYGQTV